MKCFVKEPDDENTKYDEGCYFKKIGTEDSHLSKNSFSTFRFRSGKKSQNWLILKKFGAPDEITDGLIKNMDQEEKDGKYDSFLNVLIHVLAVIERTFTL